MNTSTAGCAATACDSSEARTLFASVGDVIDALDNGECVALFDFLTNPTMFSWRNHVKWAELDPDATERCATQYRQDNEKATAVSAQFSSRELQAAFDRGLTIGVRQIDTAFMTDADNHWIPDLLNDGVLKDTDKRWFCNICHPPEIASLASAIRRGKVLDAGYLSDALNRVSVKTCCEAMLHEGTYAHRQRLLVCQSSTDAPRTFQSSIQQSMATIETFGSLLTALGDRVEKLTFAVEGKAKPN
jgi:hypothetical protein